MFTMHDILKSSNEKFFSRGKTIFNQKGAITDREFTPHDGWSSISAYVNSQSGISDRFFTEIIVCDDDTRIIDYNCSCPAARKYDSICKHSVAALLAFIDDPDSFRGYAESLVTHSSPSITRFMNRFIESGHKEVDEGSVHLRPTLINEFDKWTARFKIGTDEREYIISNIEEFARSLSEARYYEYGKQLAFTHILAAFDDESKALALMIVDAVRLQTGNYSKSGPRREAMLTEEDVIRLISASPGKRFKFIDLAGNGEEKEIAVVREIPSIDLRIVEDDDGYIIPRDNSLFIAKGASGSVIIIDDYAYLCDSSFTQASTFLKDVYASYDDEILITEEDVAKFCKTTLPMLDKSFTTTVPQRLEDLKPRKPVFAYYLDVSGRGDKAEITCELKVKYNDDEFVLLGPRNGGGPDKEGSASNHSDAHDAYNPGTAGGEISDFEPYRDIEAENEACSSVFGFFNLDMTIPLEDTEAAGSFLYGGIALLQASGEVFTTPAFDRLITDKSIRISLGLSLKGNLIDLDIKSSDLSPEELAKVLASYEHKRHFHRLKSGAVLSLDDAEIRDLARMVEDLGLKASDIATGTVELPTYSAFYLDREFSEAKRDESFDNYIYRFDEEAGKCAELPKSLSEIVRPYQLEGFKWLSKLAEMGFGGILADEMGLGKSLQMISFLLSLYEKDKLDDPTLIVCPASLVYNWAEEFAKFAPSMKAVVIDGNSTERSVKRRDKEADVFIASYDAVRQDIEKLANTRFSVVVLDEAQFIKNHATKTARAVKRLCADMRFALTGTPIENRLSEIWSIIDFLMPGFLGSYALFRKRFEEDILGGDEQATRRLSSLVNPFILRRLKSQVLTDLPEKQESVLFVALEGEQRKIYDAREQDLRQELILQKKQARMLRGKAASGQLPIDQPSHVDVLAELMRLRQTALDPGLIYEGYKGTSAKTDAILELLEESIEANHKTLVFSQFTSYLDILKAELAKRNIEFYEICGSTNKRERVRLANEFNKNDVPVFLVSLKAGGTGLNLIGAQIVIHADPWWNAAAINQATDRAHRIGQKEMVSVYKLIAKDTIEERILTLQDKKLQLADSVVSESTLASLNSLTRAELESLLLD